MTGSINLSIKNIFKIIQILAHKEKKIKGNHQQQRFNLTIHLANTLFFLLQQ